jgi:hydroxymethylglutaryl-CoA reductase
LDPYRATTHNKGIYNGIDAVVLATGNDFRAIEAAGHTYASRSGHYRSLSDCEIEDGVFRFWLEVPMAVGTVGGLTATHPLAAKSLEILGHPDAQQLMRIIASVGLAQNFGAVKSLVTTGIQHGHMRMHMQNILNSLHASTDEAKEVHRYFEEKPVSYAAVRDYLQCLRN